MRSRFVFQGLFVVCRKLPRLSLEVLSKANTAVLLELVPAQSLFLIKFFVLFFRRFPLSFTDWSKNFCFLCFTSCGFPKRTGSQFSLWSYSIMFSGPPVAVCAAMLGSRSRSTSFVNMIPIAFTVCHLSVVPWNRQVAHQHQDLWRVRTQRK